MSNACSKKALAQALSIILCGTIGGTAAAYAQAPVLRAMNGDNAAVSANPAAKADAQQVPAASKGSTNGTSQSGNKKVVKLKEIHVVATGVLHSIEFSTDAKRNATNFVDTIFAQGIGKLPDVNVAESLNNIPGVQLSRDDTGQGLQVSIRGLGASFTKVTLDGANVDTASIGLDDQNQNRSIDLNLFPPQFFTQLKVTKSPVASEIAGGIAGNVDLRTLRPFDNPGTHLTYSLTDMMTDAAKRNNKPNGYAIGSWTNSSNTFGVLLGASTVRTKQEMKGFESIGWTTPGLTYAQCGITPPAGTASNIEVPASAACNSLGGGNWRIPDTVPAGAGGGLTAGQTIDKNFLLAHNPGLDIGQISNALIPRLGRPTYFTDNRSLNSGVFSVEFRPNDNMDYYFNVLYAEAKRNTDRIDMDLVGRNGSMIPLNLKLAPNDVVTQGTFTNAQVFLEARPYQSKTQFWSADPGMDIHFTDDISLHVQGHVRRSWMRREVPSILVNSPLSTITYTNDGGTPSWQFPSGFDIDNPNLGWTWNRLNIQNGHRQTRNRGLQASLKFGDDENNVEIGASYNQEGINIQGYDNSGAWQAAACEGAGDVCSGGAGAAIPNSQLGNYLLPGPDGFITFDYSKLFAQTNYYALSKNAPLSSSVQTGATSGGFNDRDLGFFAEINTTSNVLNRPLRVNAGVRYVKTHESFSGPVLIGQATTVVNGHNVTEPVNEIESFGSNYDNFLPSFNVAWSVMPNVVIRMAGSRSMTRPDPSSMLPDTSFSDPSAQTATQGNPTLKPYQSTNFDFGGEWYTGGAGYVGVDVFEKRITGFTVNGIRSVPFSQLGIPFDTLLQVQQQAINQRGGPDNATVDVQSQVNADGTLKINGEEVNWVQPLDGLVRGLGFTVGFSHVHQESDGEGVPAVATGISPNMWKGSLYYENGPVSAHLIFDRSQGGIASGANQNGIPTARLLFAAHHELDLSASYTFKHVVSQPQIVLSVLNITKSKITTYFANTNSLYSQYAPGRTIMLGVRGTF